MRKVGKRADFRRLHFYPARSTAPAYPQPMMAWRTISIPLVPFEQARSAAWQSRYTGENRIPNRPMAVRLLNALRNYGRVCLGTVRVWSIHVCEVETSDEREPYFHVSATIGVDDRIENAFGIIIHGSTVSLADCRVRGSRRGRPCRCGAVSMDVDARLEPPFAGPEEKMSDQKWHLVMYEEWLLELRTVAISPAYIERQLFDLGEPLCLTKAQADRFASALTAMIYWSLSFDGGDVNDTIKWLDWKIKPENAEKTVLDFAVEVWRPLVVAGCTLRELSAMDRAGVEALRTNLKRKGTNPTSLVATWKDNQRWSPPARPLGRRIGKLLKRDR